MAEKNAAESDWISILIRQTLDRSIPSDEIVWLQGKFDALGMKYGIKSRKDIDWFVFQKITGKSPSKESQLLKIRFWRTGRHKPQSRRQCLELGRALELETDETRYLLQGYYDSADIVFGKADTQTPLYKERMLVLRNLERQYMTNAHPDKLDSLKIPWKNPEPFLRHYYFQDALTYVSGPYPEKDSSHFSSTNYVSEFQKSRLLLGEIPRKTIIRHLFLMSAPFLSVDITNERLAALGYLPLKEGHESRNGERLDLLIIGFIERYETECAGKSPVECTQWLHNTYRALDKKLISSGHPELRFLNFKSLKA